MIQSTKKAIIFYNLYYRLLMTHHRALAHLSEMGTKFGLAVPIPIQLDIDEHLSTIAHIEAELAELGENISSFQSPQSE